MVSVFMVRIVFVGVYVCTCGCCVKCRQRFFILENTGRKAPGLRDVFVCILLGLCLCSGRTLSSLEMRIGLFQL